MRLIIIGPQASGKGTQAEMLAKEFGMHHLSIGDRLRQEVASGSRLGQMMKEKMDAGEMVPDELVEKMLKRLIDESKGKFILDGFPRREAQAQWLDLVAQIDHVIVLKVSDKVAIERIGGRVVCPKGHDYHVKYKPPRNEGICDEDGLPLKKRSDDTTAAIMKRIAIYHAETEPVISHYKGKVIEIDGEQSIRDVHLAIVKKLR